MGSDLMAGWWYGWAFTACLLLGLGWLDGKVPQRFKPLTIFGFMFRIGRKAMVANLLMSAFYWPLLLSAIILIMFEHDNDDHFF